MSVAPISSVVSAFIGRKEELQVLGDLADAGTPLTTVFGLPGVGKSRLVQEYVASTEDQPWISIDLSTARGESEVLGRLAQIFDVVPDGSTDRAVAIGLAVGARGGVRIVLDGVGSQAPVVRDAMKGFLERAPDAQWIVVSIGVLGLAEEQTLELRPFDVREADVEPTGVDALQFWEACVRRVRRDYRVSLEDGAELRALLAKLDGIPLAIELAAARRRTLSTSELLARMNRRFALLRDVTTAGRARSIELAFRDACDALSEDERTAFLALSVFPGHFTIEEAEVAIGAAAVGDPLSLVAALREKSILASTRSEPYLLHFCETFRELAEGDLTSEIRSPVYARLLPYQVSHAKEHAEHAIASSDPKAIAWLLDHEEIVLLLAAAALDRPASPSGANDALELLATQASVAHRLRSPAAYEALLIRALADADSVERIVEHADPIAILSRATCRATLAVLATASGELDRAVALANAALVDAPSPSYARAKAFFVLGRAALLLYDEVAARNHFRESAESSDGIAERAIHLGWRQFMDVVLDGERAFEPLEASVRGALSSADEVTRGELYRLLANASAAVGRMDLAETNSLLALEIFQRTGQLRAQGSSLTQLTNAAASRGEYSEAGARSRAALDCFERSSRDPTRDQMVWAAAQTYASQLIWAGDPEEGLRVMASYPSPQDGPSLVRARTALRDAQIALAKAAAGDFSLARGLYAAVDLDAIDVTSAREYIERRAIWIDVWEANETNAAPSLRAALVEKATATIEQLSRNHNPNFTLERMMLIRGVFPASSASPSLPRWHFNSDGTQFTTPVGEVVDLGGAHVVARMIEVLLTQRRKLPGQYVPSRTIVETLWPGDRSLKHVLTNRLSVHLTKLRKIGLASILEKQGTAYRFSPLANIDVTETARRA